MCQSKLHNQNIPIQIPQFKIEDFFFFFFWIGSVKNHRKGQFCTSASVVKGAIARAYLSDHETSVVKGGRARACLSDHETSAVKGGRARACLSDHETSVVKGGRAEACLSDYETSQKSVFSHKRL